MWLDTCHSNPVLPPGGTAAACPHQVRDNPTQVPSDEGHLGLLAGGSMALNAVAVHNMELYGPAHDHRCPASPAVGRAGRVSPTGRITTGTNLAFLRGLNSGTVNLIAADPPFNKSRDFHATPDNSAKGVDRYVRPLESRRLGSLLHRLPTGGPSDELSIGCIGGSPIGGPRLRADSLGLGRRVRHLRVG